VARDFTIAPAPGGAAAPDIRAIGLAVEPSLGWVEDREEKRSDPIGTPWK